MKKFFKKLFIPHANNLYRPHAFRHKAISIYSVALMLSHLSFGIAFTSASVSAQAGGDIAKQIIGLTNTERSAFGLGLVIENEKLTLAAKDRINDMFAKNYWDHYAPEGTEPWDAVKNAGYNYSYAGENLGKGFTDANAVVGAWMNSPSHRENLLNGNYEEIGVAIGSGLLNGRNTTIIVQLFASPFEKGVKPVTVLGSKSQVEQFSLSNVFNSSNVPYSIAWIMLTLMLIADAYMLTKQGHHKDRKHKFHIGFASLLILVLFSLLTFQLVNIL